MKLVAPELSHGISHLRPLSASTECLSLWLKYLIYNWAFGLRSNYSDLQSRFYLLLSFSRFTFNRTKIIIKSKLSCWMKKFSRPKCGHCLNAVVACCNSYDFWNTSEWWWSADISLVPELNDLIFYNLMQFFHLHIHSLANGASIVVYPLQPTKKTLKSLISTSILKVTCREFKSADSHRRARLIIA